MMNAERREAKTYRLARGISWFAQGNGILIIDEVARHSEFLVCPDSVVWDMICRGHSAESVKASLCWIMGADWMPDSGIVRENLNRWIEDGLLEPADFTGKAV
jgi:hypothetical protein